MVMDKQGFVNSITHHKKLRRGPTRTEESQNDPRSDQENPRTNERRGRSDKDRSSRNQERPRSTQGRSRSNQERSRSNRDISRSIQDRSRAEEENPRSKSNQDKQRTKQENSKQYKGRRNEKVELGSTRVVRVDLLISNQNKLEAILTFFPRFRTCCCLSLRTGCLLIGWSQVIGCLIVGVIQSLIAMVCFEKINLDDLFNNFPDKINPAKTVSEFADDYCAGLSIGYASGEVVGFTTGILLLVAIFKDLVYLMRFWAYVVILTLLPTLTFYVIAIYAILQYRNDVPVIAVPSLIELASFVVLCYCTSIVKSYYYQRIEYLQLASQQEPILLKEQGDNEPEV